MILFQGCACLVHASIQLSPTPAEMEGNRLKHGDLSSAENATCARCICNRTEAVHLVYDGSVPAVAMFPEALPLHQTRRAGWNTNCSGTLMMRNSKHLRRATVDWPHLVQEEGGRLMGLALRVCGNRADAEDLVQETFLQAYRNLESFEGRSEFSTWLYTIASRICFRKRRRRAGQPDRVESLETLLPSTEHTIPDLETLDPLDGVANEVWEPIHGRSCPKQRIVIGPTKPGPDRVIGDEETTGSFRLAPTAHRTKFQNRHPFGRQILRSSVRIDAFHAGSDKS